MATKVMPHKRIDAAEALKALGAKLKDVKVQVATPKKVKGEDGIERPGFDVRMESLSERHVHSAKKWANGQVTITTIDGKRYPEGASTPAVDAEEVEADA